MKESGTLLQVPHSWFLKIDVGAVAYWIHCASNVSKEIAASHT
jgi:hypothetical protein